MDIAPLTDEERRHKELLAALSSIADMLDEQLDNPFTLPEIDLSQMVQAVQGLKGPASSEEIAEALAKKLAIFQQFQTDGWGGIASVMSSIHTALKKMDDRVIGLATRNFSGAANIPDRVDRQVGMVTTTDQDKIATQSTLAAILSNLTAATSIEFGTTTIPTGVYTSVVSFTPTQDVVVGGIAGDITALLDTRYRIRLLVGGAAKFEEQISTNANSWTPLSVNVASGVTAQVQLRHSEVTDQPCAASLQWRAA